MYPLSIAGLPRPPPGPAGTGEGVAVIKVMVRVLLGGTGLLIGAWLIVDGNVNPVVLMVRILVEIDVAFRRDVDEAVELDELDGFGASGFW